MCQEWAKHWGLGGNRQTQPLPSCSWQAVGQTDRKELSESERCGSGRMMKGLVVAESQLGPSHSCSGLTPKG